MTTLTPCWKTSKKIAIIFDKPNCYPGGLHSTLTEKKSHKKHLVEGYFPTSQYPGGNINSILPLPAASSACLTPFDLLLLTLSCHLMMFLKEKCHMRCTRSKRLHAQTLSLTDSPRKAEKSSRSVIWSDTAWMWFHVRA